MKTCFIISGGKCESYELFQSINFNDCDVICCDAGFLVAKRFGLKTKAVIGDFDTLGYIPESNCDVITFAKEKDDTDTMLAVRYAIDNGYECVRILCALGGRADHLFANLQTLFFLSKSIPDSKIISDDCEILFLNSDTITIHKDKFRFFSVFSFSDNCYGVSITGSKYQTSDGRFSNDFPLGACNEFIDDNVVISCENGSLMIVLANDINLL